MSQDKENQEVGYHYIVRHYVFHQSAVAVVFSFNQFMQTVGLTNCSLFPWRGLIC
jgi:hypothetical protein